MEPRAVDHHPLASGKAQSRARTFTRRARACAEATPSADDLGRLLDLAREVSAWATEVTQLAQSELEAGRPVTGFKLVAKRQTRSWSDEEKTEGAFRQAQIKVGDFKETKLVSPAAAERMLKRLGKPETILEGLVTTRSSGVTVAPNTDPRPAVGKGR